MLLGVIIGILAAYFLRKMFNDELLVVNVTLVCGFIAFFIAESLLERMGYMVSGIMTLVSLGCFMAAFGKTRINPEADHAVHTFWNFIVYAAETVIFFMAGVIIGARVIANEDRLIRVSDYYKLLGLYVCMNIARYLAVLMFYPYLKAHGYGLTKKEMYVLVWGGLRGAVGISFAMIAGAD